MALKDVQPGSYTARAVGGAWEKSAKKGTPGFTVGFEFDTPTGKERIRHTMYMSDTKLKDGSTVTERMMDTLFGTLGFDESRPPLQLPSGEPYFDETYFAKKEVSIVIEDEIDQADPMKVYKKVKWINELGSQMAGLTVSEALGNFDLKSHAAAARARMGVKRTAPAPVQQDKIPF